MDFSVILKLVSAEWDWEKYAFATTVVAVTVLMILLLVWRRKCRMQLLLRCGIPGPKPNFWTGNLSECFGMDNVRFDSHLFEKYGPVSGYYLGAKPVILVCDPDLLKRIEIEEGNKNFRNRPRRVPGGINPDPKRKEMLGNLPAHEWHQTRKILSTAFTPSKLRQTIPQIQEKISIFLRKVSEKLVTNPAEVDFYPLFQALTLDIIGQTGFGVDCQVQENINDKLHLAVQKEFSKSPNSSLVKFYLCFPELSWLLQPLRIAYHKICEIFGFSESSELWDQGFKAFYKRLQGPARPDLLQQLVNSELRENPLRVVANTVLFFEAAYETLSSSMGFIVHLLVNHLDVQEKVREELLSVLNGKSELEYEDLKDLKYLEMVIKEALRMYPPQTTFIGRFGDEDIIHESSDGHRYKIPAGVHIQVGLYQLHNSEQYWENPSEFNPERFRNDPFRESLIWQAFGRGPRICIGQKFAWIVLNLVLGSILSKYELQMSPSTEKNVSLKFKIATMTPANGSFAFPKLLTA